VGLALVKTTTPAAAVTATEAKQHARVVTSLDDAYVDGLIAGATDGIESVGRLQLVSATFDWFLDRFPVDFFEFPKSPATAVNSIKYLDVNGVEQTLSTDVFKTDFASLPGRIALKHNQSWPDTRGEINSVTVDFVAGYANAAAVPSELKTAIHLTVAHIYANRENVVVGTITAEVPQTAKDLFMHHRVLEVC